MGDLMPESWIPTVIIALAVGSVVIACGFHTSSGVDSATVDSVRLCRLWAVMSLSPTHGNDILWILFPCVGIMRQMNVNDTLKPTQIDPGAKETKRLPAAVFWDMDGTLIDSEPYWADGERYVIEKHGGQWSDNVPLRARGQSTPRIIEIVKEYFDEPVDDDTLRDELVGYVIGREKETPCWTTGSLELLCKLADAGIPNVIVSASPRAMVSNMVEQGPKGAFVGYVCGEDGLAAKPDPAPYLRAAEIVGADPQDCLVFEDSKVGLESGGASGATVVAITGFTPEGVVFDGPQVVNIKDYTGLEFGDLAKFMELSSVKR